MKHPSPPSPPASRRRSPWPRILTILALMVVGGIVYAAPGDLDGDGIPDIGDNCPNVANPLQENADGDTLGDACDKCGAHPFATLGRRQLAGFGLPLEVKLVQQHRCTELFELEPHLANQVTGPLRVTPCITDKDRGHEGLPPLAPSFNSV